MRIWDIDPSRLCRAHLLGEHRELHGLWNILTLDRRGYRSHPETQRWEGKLAALYRRHESLVREMGRRGYRHRSELDPDLATGSDHQDLFVDSVERQFELLRLKGCDCWTQSDPPPELAHPQRARGSRGGSAASARSPRTAHPPRARGSRG